MIAISPVALVALYAAVAGCVRLRRWLAAAERESLRRASLQALLDATPFCLLLVFCFSPSVSASIFKAWSCQAYTVSAQQKVEYMRQAPPPQSAAAHSVPECLIRPPRTARTLPSSVAPTSTARSPFSPAA